MITKSVAELHDLTRRILIAAGAAESNANEVAEHLAESNLCGVDTHGVWHLPGYVQAIRDGYIAPTALPAVAQEKSNTALVIGNWTFGHVAAKFATKLGIVKARKHDIALISIVQTNHIGRLGYYVEMAAAEGMISMVFAGGFGIGEPVAVPYGGRKPIFHTNPIAMSFPTTDGEPMMFDYATTAVSGVKVMNALRRGEKLPPGCIVGKDGNPSTNPNDFSEGGAYVPFGGHKGYALMIATEMLGRVFSGADAFADTDYGGPQMRHQGNMMILFRADLFQDFSDYTIRAEELRQRVHATPPAPGFSEVLAPGDPEARTRKVRTRDGIPVANDIWESLVELATDLGVEID